MAKKKRTVMAKRRTIGDNPFDAVVPDPSAWLPKPTKKPVKTQAVKRTPDQPPGPDSILQRIECLEGENQCMKWLVGAVLAPLALLAILL
jgi:hypothetical protein